MATNFAAAMDIWKALILPEITAQLNRESIIWRYIQDGNVTVHPGVHDSVVVEWEQAGTAFAVTGPDGQAWDSGGGMNVTV